MSYTDEEMLIATQIAYIDFDQDMMYSGLSVKEALEIMQEHKGGSSDKNYAKICKLYARIKDSDKYNNWKIKDVRDDQKTSGMYACMLDTGDGNALVSFRGSEDGSLDDYVKDWGLSDIGLLNSVLTPQQITAQKYLEDIYKNYGNTYDKFSLTGHSLGGNLAEHATITASDGMREKIERCANLDGPGFSRQYHLAHKNDIRKSAKLINHYQWSWCGRLLYPVPGGKYVTIKANTPEKSNSLEAHLWRHDTYNVTDFDNDGGFLQGNPDILAITVDPLAKYLDFYLFMTGGSAIIALTYNVFDSFKDALTYIRNRWEEVQIMNMHAEFHINANMADQGLDQLGTIVPRMNELQHRVEQIQKELAFDSLAAGYVKVRLWNVATDMERDVQKMNTFCSKGNECIQNYKLYEQRIADNYC